MVKLSFQELLTNSTIPVLVDFWAEWCGPCKALSPIIAHMADELEGRLKVVKVNVDRNPAAAQRYGVQGIPALLLFDKGKLVWRSAGARPYATLLAELEPYLRVA